MVIYNIGDIYTPDTSHSPAVRSEVQIEVEGRVSSEVICINNFYNINTIGIPHSPEIGLFNEMSGSPSPVTLLLELINNFTRDNSKC